MTTSLMTMMMMRKTRLKCFLHNFFSIQQKWTGAGLQSICSSTVTPLPPCLFNYYPYDTVSVSVFRFAMLSIFVSVFVLGFSLSLSSSSSFCMHRTKNLRLLAVQAQAKESRPLSPRPPRTDLAGIVFQPDLLFMKRQGESSRKRLPLSPSLYPLPPTLPQFLSQSQSLFRSYALALSQSPSLRCMV